MTKYTKLRHGYTRDIVLNREEESVPAISSLEVAEMVERRHDHVLRDINVYIDYLNEDGSVKVSDYFIQSKRRDRKGEMRPYFLLTKEGCHLYASRMTGEKGAQFAVAYNQRFADLKEELPKVTENKYNKEKILVQVQDKQVITTSLIVADTFEKEHRNVLRDIRELKKDMLNFEHMFHEGETEDSYGRPRKTYFMNRDGFSLLAMGFTGKKALQFKLKFIEQFNLMEKALKEQSEPRVLSREELIAASMELTLAHKEKLKELDERVEENQQDIDYLKKDMRIDRRQERILQRKGAKKVIQELGGKHTNAYDKCSRKAFAELWGSFKNYFEVGSYSDIPRIKFEEACDYIDVWRPSTRLAIEIKDANRQMSLDIKNGTVTTRGGNQ